MLKIYDTGAITKVGTREEFPCRLLYEPQDYGQRKEIKKFRVYLLELDFKIITDCEAIQKTLQKQNLSPKTARWALMLEEFSYQNEHRAGERIKHADALSGCPVMIISKTD